MMSLAYYGLSFNPFDKQMIQEKDRFLSHDMKDENGNDIPSLIEENDIRCISFVFKGINEGGTVFIDNVNLVR